MAPVPLGPVQLNFAPSLETLRASFIPRVSHVHRRFSLRRSEIYFTPFLRNEFSLFASVGSPNFLVKAQNRFSSQLGGISSKF